MLDEVNNRAQVLRQSILVVSSKFQGFVEIVFFFSVRYHRVSLGTIKDKQSKPKQTNNYA
jgi:hypothetical protein